MWEDRAPGEAGGGRVPGGAWGKGEWCWVLQFTPTLTITRGRV